MNRDALVPSASKPNRFQGGLVVRPEGLRHGYANITRSNVYFRVSLSSGIVFR